MNEQLLSHLENFEESSVNSDHLQQNDAPYLLLGVPGDKSSKPSGTVIARTKFLLNPFSVALCHSAKFDLPIWIIATGIILTKYIALSSSLSLFIIGLVITNLQSHSQEISEQGTEVSASMKSNNESMSKQKRKKAEIGNVIQDCRVETSRLLGLIGAPPLDWCDSQTDNYEDMSSQLKSIVALLLSFLDAHAQFILAVDEVYQWLNISAGLHLGLGARSQCVERVERASIYRHRRSMTEKLKDHAKSNSSAHIYPELQRGRTSSVLSLSHVRQHVVECMIEQSKSLLEVWHGANKALEPTDDIINQDSLLEPDVIDLIWIKSARHSLVSLLASSASICCTVEGLEVLNMREELQKSIQSSQLKAQVATEFLTANILFDKERASKPLPDTNNQFLLKMLQYREQLDALSAAIWTCQHISQEKVAPGSAAQIDWWERILALVSTCRNMEKEIGSTFFSHTSLGSTIEDRNIDSKSDEGNLSGSNNDSNLMIEYEISDLGDNPRPSDSSAGRALSTKTLVFKGCGAMSNDLGTPQRHSTTYDETASVVPPRNAVSERQMIQELQNRISLIRSEQDDDSDEEDFEASKESQRKLDPTAPIFLGASGALLSELKQSIPSPLVGVEEEIQDSDST